MGSGGGNTTTVQKSDPWAGAQPYLKDLFARGRQAADNPTSYYPGQLVAPLSGGEQQGFQDRADYLNQVFAGAPAPSFGAATSTLNSTLAGGPAAGLAAGTGNLALSQLQSGFGQGVPQLRDVNMTPGQFGTAGSLDATDAIRTALEGRPDYSGVEAATRAASAPILDQLNNEIIPGLNQRATFLNNPTGGIKTLNRVLPQVENHIADIGTTLADQERQRALTAQQSAANLVSQGGLSSFGAGLNAAQLGLNRDVSQAGLEGDRLSQILGLGGLAGSLAGTQQQGQIAGLGLFPTISSAGEAPGLLEQAQGQTQRDLSQQGIDAELQRYLYNQNAPNQALQQYSGILSGLGGLGGSSSTTQNLPSGSKATGALGGAATGASIGSAAGPYGTAIGAIIGGLGGLFL